MVSNAGLRSSTVYIKMPYSEAEVPLVFPQLGHLVLEAYREETSFSQTTSMRVGHSVFCSVSVGVVCCKGM